MDRRHVPRQSSSLRAGIITETAGGPIAVSLADIGRIYYYSWVRRILRSSSAIVSAVILLALSSCYSGSRPPRIGNPAPVFTVKDSEHAVTLSQFKGQVVVLN